MSPLRYDLPRILLLVLLGLTIGITETLPGEVFGVMCLVVAVVLLVKGCVLSMIRRT